MKRILVVDDEPTILAALTKPFSMRELVARVRVLLRRMDRAGEPAAGAPALFVEHVVA